MVLDCALTVRDLVVEDGYGAELTYIELQLFMHDVEAPFRHEAMQIF